MLSITVVDQGHVQYIYQVRSLSNRDDILQKIVDGLRKAKTHYAAVADFLYGLSETSEEKWMLCMLRAMIGTSSVKKVSDVQHDPQSGYMIEIYLK